MHSMTQFIERSSYNIPSFSTSLSVVLSWEAMALNEELQQTCKRVSGYLVPQEIWNLCC